MFPVVSINATFIDELHTELASAIGQNKVGDTKGSGPMINDTDKERVLKSNQAAVKCTVGVGKMISGMV
jgi:hypothetical protein